MNRSEKTQLKRRSLPVTLLCMQITLIALHCNNYNLKEKLENPGSLGKHYAFVTSAVTLGDMTGLTNGSCPANGFARADCACTDLAVSRKLTRTASSKFVAWLSSATNEMRCRITGTTGVGCAPSGGPTWYNTKDETIANGFADLLDGTLSGQLKYTETTGIPAQTSVWSGTNGLGQDSGSQHCTNWTDGTAGVISTLGTIGVTNDDWSDGAGGSNTCANTHHVYCFAIP